MEAIRFMGEADMVALYQKMYMSILWAFQITVKKDAYRSGQYG